MYKNLNYKQQEEIKKRIKSIEKTIGIIVLTIILAFWGHTTYISNTKDYITIDEYTTENDYELKNSLIYSDKVIVEGVEKDFVTINNKSLDDYWKEPFNPPEEGKIRELYYDGSKIYTIDYIKHIVQLQNNENDIEIINLIINAVILYLALAITSALIKNKFNLFLHFVLGRRMARKYIIQL